VLRVDDIKNLSSMPVPGGSDRVDAAGDNSGAGEEFSAAVGDGTAAKAISFVTADEGVRGNEPIGN
jgi:hypothetical protein